MFDAMGRKMSSLKSNFAQPIVTGSNLGPGIYFAEIRQGKYKKTVKLIKQ